MEKRILKRHRSKKVSRILTQGSDIGKEIENFVKESGAVLMLGAALEFSHFMAK